MASQTIARNHPAMLIEIEERHNPGGLRRIADRLGHDGYHGFFFRNGERCPLASFSAEADQPLIEELQAPATTKRKPVYINNFLFLQQGR